MIGVHRLHLHGALRAVVGRDPARDQLLDLGQAGLDADRLRALDHEPDHQPQADRHFEDCEGRFEPRDVKIGAQGAIVNA